MLDPHFPWMGSSHFPFGIIGQIAPFRAQIAVPAPLYILRITAKESPNLGHTHMSRGIGVGTDLAMHVCTIYGDLHAIGCIYPLHPNITLRSFSGALGSDMVLA